MVSIPNFVSSMSCGLKSPWRQGSFLAKKTFGWRNLPAQYIHPLSTCVPSFNFVDLTVLEKSVTKIFIWKRYRITEWKSHIAPNSLVLETLSFWLWFNCFWSFSFNSTPKYFWKEPNSTNKMASKPRKDSDQSVHLHSLIRFFAVHMTKHWVLSYL